MKQVSLMDVAAAAGVSHATVARVLHNNGSVSPKTRELVEAKLKELGYVPNQMARILKSKSSGIIGSLFIHNASGLIHQINESISRAALDNGKELLVIETQMGNEASAIDNFLALRAEGIVIISDPFVPQNILQRLHQLSVPVVAVERGYHANGVDNVLVQDFDACYSIGRRMVEMGHRRIGLIEAQELESVKETPELNVEHLRRTGFLAALSDLDISPLTRTVSSYSTRAAYNATEELLALADPPTAIFATADRLAAGILQCLYDHHLRIPTDMSVIGYDNVLSARLSPPLDSVALVYDDIGSQVLDLIRRRNEDPTAPEIILTIPTKYVSRGTLLPL